MALTTFTYNGIPSTAFSVNVEKVTRPILPPTRDRHETVATRHGEWDFGPYYNSVKIDLDCWISVADRPTLNALTDQIAVWLDPLNGAKPLVISDQPDRYWNARISGSLDITLIVGYGSFKIPFLCTDPFAHPI